MKKCELHCKSEGPPGPVWCMECGHDPRCCNCDEKEAEQIEAPHDELSMARDQIKGINRRVEEIALKHCADYPNVDLVDTWEQLWAIEGTLKGVTEANDDLHDIIRELTARLGMGVPELLKLSMKVRQAREKAPEDQKAVLGEGQTLP